MYKFYIQNNGTAYNPSGIVLDEQFDNWVGSAFPNDLPVGWDRYNRYDIALGSLNYINQEIIAGNDFLQIKSKSEFVGSNYKGALGILLPDVFIPGQQYTIDFEFNGINKSRVDLGAYIYLRNGTFITQYIYRANSTGDKSFTFTATETFLVVELVLTNPQINDWFEVLINSINITGPQTDPLKDEVEILPLYPELNLVAKLEDGSFIWPEELDGDIQVKDDDFDLIKPYEELNYTFLDMRIEEYDTDTAAYFTRFITELSLTGEWDVDKKIAALKIKNLNRYTNTLDNAKEAINPNEITKASILREYDTFVDIIFGDDYAEKATSQEDKATFRVLDSANFITSPAYGRIKVNGNANTLNNPKRAFNDWFTLPTISEEGNLESAIKDTDYGVNIDTLVQKIPIANLSNYTDPLIIESDDDFAVIIERDDVTQAPIDILVPDGFFLNDFFVYFFEQYDPDVIVQKSFLANGKFFRFYEDYPIFDTAILVKKLAMYWQSQYDDVTITFEALTRYLADNFSVYWDVIVNENTGDKYFTLLYYGDLFQVDSGFDLQNYLGENWVGAKNKYKRESSVKPYVISRTNNGALDDFKGVDIKVKDLVVKTGKRTINNSQFNNDVYNVTEKKDGSGGDFCMLDTTEENVNIEINSTIGETTQVLDVAVAPGSKVRLLLFVTDLEAGNHATTLLLNYSNEDVYNKNTTDNIVVIGGISLGTTVLEFDIPSTKNINIDTPDTFYRSISLAFFTGYKATITAVSINDGKGYRINKTVGELSGVIRENAGFSQANIDENYLTALPEEVVIINNVEKTVTKESDKTQSDIDLTIEPNTDTINYRNFVTSNVGNCYIKDRTRNLQTRQERLVLSIIE